MAISKIRQSMVKGLTDDMINSSQEETVIYSKNLSIKDDVIEINAKHDDVGVSSGMAGIKINRGTLDPVLLVFDEKDDIFKMGTENNMKSIASQDWVTEKIDNLTNDISQDMTQEEITLFIEDIIN